MAVNTFFQPDTPAQEEKLVEDLIIEHIQLTGMNVYFLPQDAITVDNLFNEHQEREFKNAHLIEMKLEQVEGFDTNNMFADFGLELSQTATFAVSIKRFSEETSLEHPKMGDLLYIPATKNFLEIKDVVDDDPFYQTGKKFVHSLSCQLFDHSKEDIETGDEEIDSLLQDMADIDTILIDDDNDPETDPIETTQNELIEDEADKYQVFDEDNPFGSY